MVPGEKISMDNIDDLVKKHMPFIIRTVSNLTGKYVSVENDESFSVALDGFVESVEKYNPERGEFLYFSRMVMESRLKSFFIKDNKRIKCESIEELSSKGREFVATDESESQYMIAVREELGIYKEELLKFGLTLEKLADNAPKHKDTKERAMRIARIASDNETIVEITYRKRKLPIRAVAKLTEVTEKVVKKSKIFILSTMLIFVRNLPELTRFILKRGGKDVL